jgi:hypothetical protein
MSWLWPVARAASCISWSQNRWKFAPSVMANFFTLTDLKMGRLESDFLFDSFSLFLCFFSSVLETHLCAFDGNSMRKDHETRDK